MSLHKTLARLQLANPEVAATDAKGAAAAIQKVLDKNGLSLKAKVKSYGSSNEWVTVQGKTKYGPVGISFDLSNNKKELVVDYYDLEGVSIDQMVYAVSHKHFGSDPEFSGTKGADLKRLRKEIDKMEKAATDMKECLATCLDFWARWEKALTQISAIVQANK